MEQRHRLSSRRPALWPCGSGLTFAGTIAPKKYSIRRTHHRSSVDLRRTPFASSARLALPLALTSGAGTGYRPRGRVPSASHPCSAFAAPVPPLAAGHPGRPHVRSAARDFCCRCCRFKRVRLRHRCFAFSSMLRKSRSQGRLFKRSSVELLWETRPFARRPPKTTTSCTKTPTSMPALCSSYVVYWRC